MTRVPVGYFAVLLATASSSACVDGVGLPELIPQAQVAYGGKIYLVDATRDSPPGSGRCTRIGMVSTSTNPPSVASRDHIAGTINSVQPHSCYVMAKPKTLKVDVVESTNALFQLCLDSGQCRAPDPNKASKNQVCHDEAKFDACPIVEVGYDEATRFCGFVGRRLPSGFEHFIIRQLEIGDAETAVFPALPNGREMPSTCEDAILKSGACLKPRPVLDGGQAIGAAKNDRVDGTNGVVIHDLIGNVSEWTSDLLPTDRGTARDYPWFCVSTLPGAETGFSAANPPRCPTGASCVFAQYKPAPDLPLRSDWPLCVTSTDGHFTGSQGSLVSGSYRDDKTDPDHIGIFSRRVEKEPNELPDTARAREYGIRCVGDREPDASGNLPEFDDRLELEVTP